MGLDRMAFKRDPQVKCGRIGTQSVFMNEFNTNKDLEGKVLLDTGANEVVRNFSYREWSDIDLRRPGTRQTQVKLVGNKFNACVFGYQLGVTIQYMRNTR